MMTPLAYEAWKKRWNRESKSRKVISVAFEVYRDMYGEESAKEVVKLSVQHSSTSHDISVVGRFRNFERFWTVAKRTPEA